MRLQILPSHCPLLKVLKKKKRNSPVFFLQLQSALTAEGTAKRRSFVDPAVSKGCSDESVKTVMEICLRCLAKEAVQRPSIEDVLWNLQFAAQVQDDWEGDNRSSDGSMVSSSSRITKSSRFQNEQTRCAIHPNQSSIL